MAGFGAEVWRNHEILTAWLGLRSKLPLEGDEATSSRTAGGTPALAGGWHMISSRQGGLAQRGASCTETGHSVSVGFTEVRYYA